MSSALMPVSESTMPEFASNHPASMEDPLGVFPRLITKFFSVWLKTTYPFHSIGRDVSIHHTVVISRRMAPAICIGSSVMIRKDAWLNTFDVETVNGPTIVIEDGCLIGAGDVISAKNRIHIERDVIIGKYVLMQDHNHAYEDLATPIKAQGVTTGGRIRIEQGCWIGQGAAIVSNQDELVIGRNSVIASNALVTKSCPPHSVLIGNPARLARQYDPTKGAWVGGNGRPSSVNESA
jgi:acetyltransferase-like isoleucine patch superfamily enzyme